MAYKLKLITKYLYIRIFENRYNPKGIIKVFDKSKLLKFINIEAIKSGKGISFDYYSTKKSFIQRRYKTYEEYIKHQSVKHGLIKNNYDSIRERDNKFRAILLNRIKKTGIIDHGMKVLCLGARFGTEVKSFLDLGCFAIGIDLTPGEKNKYVMYGNFEQIQFPADSVDVIYTNSLDHAYDIDKIVFEIRRVLHRGGYLILEAVIGIREKGFPGRYESFFWRSLEDLKNVFNHHDFELLLKYEIDYPFPGQHLLFRLEEK